GERREYRGTAGSRSELGGPMTWDHSMPGHLLLLLGENLTQYRIWDATRALDYLLSLPQVDPQRIGCTGQSSGGLFTMFLSAIDSRIRCAAAHEGECRRSLPVEIRPETAIDPPDIDQHFFPSALWGIDLTDLHAAIAPRPLLVTNERCSPEFLDAVAVVGRRYRRAGASDRFSTASADDPHGMTMKLRMATVDWFSRWFYQRKGPPSEPDLALEPRENLYCTATGSIRESRQGDTLLSRIAKRQALLPPVLPEPSGDTAIEGFRRSTIGQIRQLLHLRKETGTLGIRALVTTPRHGYRVEKVEFLSEPGIYLPVWVFVPENVTSSVPVLYVSDRGIESEGLEFGPVEALAKAGRIVAAVDVRGIGETQPPHPDAGGPNEFRHLDSVETAMSYMAWEMDESLFGMRVQDVRRSVDFLEQRTGAGDGGVHAI
ncbi:MAG: alpha/beta hydrolase family protein, partial [Bryobacteraceae bacterium]